MEKKATKKKSGKKVAKAKKLGQDAHATRRRSAVVDTGVVYCGDNLDQLGKLPDGCVGLVYIDPPFNSNRNYEVFWGETKKIRAFEVRHASTQACACGHKTILI